VLEVGWGAVRETFTSRIYCVPGRIVEAVAGGAVTSVDEHEAEHHTHVGATSAADKASSGDILTHLLTKWEVTPLVTDPGSETTKVALDIEFQFANPVYAAMSQVAAGAVAEKMIEAFETRIREEMLAHREQNGAELRQEQRSG
jgi:coenzyme Q-binding protein COQ10